MSYNSSTSNNNSTSKKNSVHTSGISQVRHADNIIVTDDISKTIVEPFMVPQGLYYKTLIQPRPKVNNVGDL